MVNLDQEQRRVVQMRVALRRLVSAAQPLTKNKLFDNPPKQYPEWQRHAINRLAERGMVTINGDNVFRRTYQLGAQIDRQELRQNLQDDLWISALLWPKQDFVLQEEILSQPEPVVADATETPNTAGLSDRELLEALFHLFGLAIDKLDRVERAAVRLEKGVTQCNQILKELM